MARLFLYGTWMLEFYDGFPKLKATVLWKQIIVVWLIPILNFSIEAESPCPMHPTTLEEAQLTTETQNTVLGSCCDRCGSTTCAWRLQPRRRR